MGAADFRNDMASGVTCSPRQLWSGRRVRCHKACAWGMCVERSGGGRVQGEAGASTLLSGAP